MSTSTSTSTQPNQQPTLQLPGYFYDPIKKRYFKGETKEKNVSTKSTQQDSKRQRPVQRRQSEKRKQRSISLRPNFDPELHPGSLADRQRYISLAGSKPFRKGRMRTKSIAYPNIRVQGGEFDPLRAIEIVVGPDGKRELFLGFSDSAILYGDLEDLIDPSTFNAENLGYHLGTHEDFDVELFPTANLEPISSMKFINGWFSVTRLNLSSTIKVDQEWASDPFNFNSFKTDSVVKDFWCSTLTSTHQLTGGEKGIVLKDLLTNQRRTVKTSQSIISLETLQDDVKKKSFPTMLFNRYFFFVS
ncbi:hypothetical protein BY996DRAFT_7022321 [Phakopsora pachyrhizi]|nr:hypothetical protein BY996DRAFT_7022321 [Phakopsora pachyrhizi]